MAQPTQERLASQLEKPEQTSGNVGHAGSGVGPENAPHFEDHEDDHVHHVAMPTYYAVFALLMVLLFITVGAWYIDQHVFSLGRFSTPVAMIIAVAKAVAIVLIFMHVKFSSRLVQIFACTGIAFVSIMFLLTFNDYGTRDWLPRPGTNESQLMENGSIGGNGQNSGFIVRSSSVGTSPNAQSAPSDSMAPTSGTAVGNGRLTNMPVMGADIRIAPGTASMDSNAPTSGVIGQRDDARPGAIVGGAANNSFGSTAQSKGIEPSRNQQVPAKTTTKPAVAAPATR